MTFALSNIDPDINVTPLFELDQLLSSVLLGDYLTKMTVDG